MSIIKLNGWEEYSGVLKKFFYNERELTITLIFLCGDSITFPFDDIDYNFDEMIGRKIGILRTDLREKEYIIRCENIKNNGG